MAITVATINTPTATPMLINSVAMVEANASDWGCSEMSATCSSGDRPIEHHRTTVWPPQHVVEVKVRVDANTREIAEPIDGSVSRRKPRFEAGAMAAEGGVSGDCAVDSICPACLVPAHGQAIPGCVAVPVAGVQTREEGQRGTHVGPT